MKMASMAEVVQSRLAEAKPYTSNMPQWLSSQFLAFLVANEMFMINPKAYMMSEFTFYSLFSSISYIRPQDWNGFVQGIKRNREVHRERERSSHKRLCQDVGNPSTIWSRGNKNAHTHSHACIQVRKNACTHVRKIHAILAHTSALGALHQQFPCTPPQDCRHLPRFVQSAIESSEGKSARRTNITREVSTCAVTLLVGSLACCVIDTRKLLQTNNKHRISSCQQKCNGAVWKTRDMCTDSDSQAKNMIIWRCACTLQRTIICAPSARWGPERTPCATRWHSHPCVCSPRPLELFVALHFGGRSASTGPEGAGL